MELKDRVVVISKKNMDSINALYGKCTTDELERVVNNMIDNAVVEINGDRSRLHMDKTVRCSECEFMKYLRQVVFRRRPVGRWCPMGNWCASGTVVYGFGQIWP